MDKYVIIDREFIEKRIETLEKDVRFYQKENSINEAHKCLGELLGLKEILTRTTPLIPEIRKAFESGQDYQGRFDKNLSIEGKTIGDYISTLKF